MEKDKKHLLIGVTAILISFLAGYGILYSISKENSEGLLGFVRGGMNKNTEEDVGIVVFSSREDVKVNWQEAKELVDNNLPLAENNVDCSLDDHCAVFIEGISHPVIIPSDGYGDQENYLEIINGYFESTSDTLAQIIEEDGDEGELGYLDEYEVVIPKELDIDLENHVVVVPEIIDDIFCQSIYMAPGLSKNDLENIAVYLTLEGTVKNKYGEFNLYYDDGAVSWNIVTKKKWIEGGVDFKSKIKKQKEKLKEKIAKLKEKIKNKKKNKGKKGDGEDDEEEEDEICPDCPSTDYLQYLINEYMDNNISVEEMINEIEMYFEVNAYSETEIDNFGNLFVQ